MKDILEQVLLEKEVELSRQADRARAWLLHPEHRTPFFADDVLATVTYVNARRAAHLAFEVFALREAMQQTSQV